MWARHFINESRWENASAAEDNLFIKAMLLIQKLQRTESWIAGCLGEGELKGGRWKMLCKNGESDAETLNRLRTMQQRFLI